MASANIDLELKKVCVGYIGVCSIVHNTYLRVKNVTLV